MYYAIIDIIDFAFMCSICVYLISGLLDSGEWQSAYELTVGLFYLYLFIFKHKQIKHVK